jgi:hypothetical protein
MMVFDLSAGAIRHGMNAKRQREQKSKAAARSKEAAAAELSSVCATSARELKTQLNQH